MSLPPQVTAVGTPYVSQGQTYAAGLASEGATSAEQTNAAQYASTAQGMVNQSLTASGGDIDKLSGSATLLSGAANILKNPKATPGDLANATLMLASAYEGMLIAVTTTAEAAGLVTAADVVAVIPVIGPILLAAAAVIVAAAYILNQLDGASANAPAPLSDSDKTRWGVGYAIGLEGGKASVTSPSVPFYQDPKLPVTLKAIQLASIMSQLLANDMDAHGFPYIKNCGGPSGTGYDAPCTDSGTLSNAAMAILSPGQIAPVTNLYNFLASVLFQKEWPTSIDARWNTLDFPAGQGQYNTDPSTLWGLGLRGTGITFSATDVQNGPNGFTTPATVAQPNFAAPSNEPSELFVYLACAAALNNMQGAQAYIGNVLAIRLAQYAWVYKSTQATGSGIDAPQELYCALGMMLDWQSGESFALSEMSVDDTTGRENTTFITSHETGLTLAQWVNHYNTEYPS